MRKYRHVKIVEVKLDLSETKSIYKEIEELHKKYKTYPKEFAKLSSNKITELRRELSLYGGLYYEVQVKTKDELKVYEYANLPKADEIRTCLDQAFGEVRTKRAATRQKELTTKSYNGIEYKVMGGVFMGDHSIIGLSTVSSHAQRIKKAKAPSTRDKHNYVGIELELISRANRDETNAALAAAKLGGYVHVKSDSSISRSEPNESTHEVTVMCKQEMVADILGRVLAVLKTQGAYVNDSCGTHVHFDMRNRNVETSYSRMYYLQNLLKSMVTPNRIGNTYCQTNEIATFSKAASTYSKYYIVNPGTYSRYKTLECRLHNGTLSLTKLVNWIKLITYAIDNEPTATFHIADTKDLVKAYPNISTKLVAYVDKRVADLKVKKITTQEDHELATYNLYEMAV